MKEQLPGGDALDSLSFLSTHPPTPERVARLEQLIAKSAGAGNYAKVNVDFKAFQQALRAQLSQPEKKPEPKKPKGPDAPKAN